MQGNDLHAGDDTWHQGGCGAAAGCHRGACRRVILRDTDLHSGMQKHSLEFVSGSRYQARKDKGHMFDVRATSPAAAAMNRIQDERSGNACAIELRFLTYLKNNMIKFFSRARLV